MAIELVTVPVQAKVSSYAMLVVRLLLGLLFTVFGLNGFLHFLPMPMPEGIGGQFIGALVQSHYLEVVFAIQLVAGVLLLPGWFVPLALTLLGPIVVNILLFHALMEPQGLPIASLAALLWLAAFWGSFQKFAAIFTK